MFAKVTDCSVDMDLLGVYCSPKKQETDLLPSLFYLNVSAKVQFGKNTCSLLHLLKQTSIVKIVCSLQRGNPIWKLLSGECLKVVFLGAGVLLKGFTSRTELNILNDFSNLYFKNF